MCSHTHFDGHWPSNGSKTGGELFRISLPIHFDGQWPFGNGKAT